MASDYVVGLYEGLVLAETVKVPRGALKFTNTSGQLRLGAGPSSGSSFSFCSWVKITTDTNAYTLWLSLQGASTTYWEAGFDTTGTGSIVNDAFTERAVGINFTVGTWYFFGVSQSSGNCKVMIGTEGGALTKFTSTLANLTLPLSEKLYGGELSLEALSGAMSEARFWNAALTDAEFLTEYYSAVQARTSNAGGYHKLENTTSKLTDSSAASNNLTAPTGTGTWTFEPGPNIAPAPFGAPFENVAVSETIDAVYTAGSGGTAYTGNVSETVTVSESLAALDAATVGLAETDSLSESLGSARGAIAGLAETVTLSESTAAAYAAVVPTPETVTLSEALGTQSNEASGLAETVTLSESMSGGSAFTAATSETVTVSESTSAVYAATAATSETVSIGESSGSQAVMASGLSETVALSESLAGGSAFAASLGETVTDSEGGAFTYSAMVAPAETVTNSESVTGIQSGGGGTAYTGDVNETVTVSEGVAALFAASVATSEALFVTLPPMTELGTTDLHLVAEDWTPGTGWASRVGGFTAALNGSLSKQEEPGIERAGILGFGTSNYFSLAANAAHEFTTSSRYTYEFLVRPGAAGGNLFGRYASPYGGGYELAAFSAAAIAGVYEDGGSSYYAIAVSASTLTANAYYLITFVLDATGNAFQIYLNGVLDYSTTGGGVITNTTAVPFYLGNSNGNDQGFDGSIVEVLRHRSALDAATILARYRALSAAGASVGIAIGPSETVTTSEASASAYSATPSVAETLAISDATTLAQVLAQGLAETVSVAESSTALAGFVRGIAETVSFSEAFASSIVQSAALAETVTLAELVGLAQVLANGLAESVALAEAMIGYVPRVLVTELGEPTAVKTAATTVASVVSVETDAPAAVKTGSTTLLGLP